MSIEDIGRTHMFDYDVDDVYLNMRDVGTITFYVHEVDGATSSTITFSDDTSGTTTSTPDVIDHYYGKSVDTASNAWHLTTQTAAETVVATDATEDLIAITVTEEMCPDGKPYVKCTSDGAATVAAVFGALQEQRDPENIVSYRT